MGHDELLTGVRITGLLVTTKQLAGFLLVPSGLAAPGTFGHVIESMTFKPNAWWTEKSQDMDLFKERTGIALEPTVQESPWYFVR